MRVADDGRLMLGGKTMRGPLAISNVAVRAQLTGAAMVARGADYELWMTAGNAANGALRGAASTTPAGSPPRAM